ncbi:phage major capsid protein [Rossellomorea marisflavi]|uniref:Capsid protein n=1 Tax=Rossellomorea marisflavi TaxID=189381 RepID=A0A165LZC5_9BACI|nr:phage major capsid protein [Rossellomorea marisflavi]KQU57722.1 capsid protein [Bacillus sp. Leaf406]KZE53402.1 capsid protein [Rossellomorea marisflavi]WJV19656.1 phage major capsid protein [Rossellomorea marisflavi]
MKSKLNLLTLDIQFFAGINNPDDPIIQNKEEQVKAMQDAFETGDASAVASSIVSNFENNMARIQGMMNDVAKEARQASAEQWDNQVLASRGVRVLTSEEKKFYNQAIEAESFDEVIKLVPPTVFERVFEDLEKEHPLLSRVNFQKTGARTAWVLRKPGQSVAFWGEVTASIQEMLDEGFRTVEQGMYKLSGFLVVSKAMFELGPQWLDRYVRMFMAEVIADELEDAIVNGDGNKKPIGMTRDLEAPIQGGVYALKTPQVLADFTPKTIGREILAPTTKNGTRRYTGVTLMVNPMDYAIRFFPLGAKQKDDGSWTYDNFSVPGLEIIQSPAVTLGQMISGKPKDYFMGVGAEQKLETTDVLRMIEDQRLYLVRQLANGRPLDPDSFTVFDISQIGEVEATPEV